MPSIVTITSASGLSTVPVMVVEPSLSGTIGLIVTTGASGASSIGRSVSGVTVTLTGTSTVPPLPSSTVTVKLSSPLKSGFGVYVYSPVAGSIVTVPFLGDSLMI